MRPITYIAVAFAVSASAIAAGAIHQPNLTGTWTLEGFMGRGPLGLRSEHAVCPLPATGPATNDSHRPGGPSNILPDTEEVDQVSLLGTVEIEITVTQSALEITVDRKFSGSIASGSHRNVFKLDGTESSTTMGQITSLAKSRWEGAALVVDHYLTWGTSADASCRVRETFSVDSGVLSIVATSDLNGVSRMSRQTYVKKGR